MLLLVLTAAAVGGCGSGSSGDSGSSDRGSGPSATTKTASMFDKETRDGVEVELRSELETKMTPDLEKKGHHIDGYTVGCQPDTEWTFTCTVDIDATAENGECGTFTMEMKGVLDPDGSQDITSRRMIDDRQSTRCP